MKGNEWQNTCSRLDLLLDWALAGKFQALYMDIQGLLDTPEQFIRLVQYLHPTWPTEFSETKPTLQFQLQSYQVRVSSSLELLSIFIVTSGPLGQPFTRLMRPHTTWT